MGSTDLSTRGPRVAREGEEETGEVAALTHEGEGVVRGGKTAFVVGALPGERIKFRRTKRHKQHDDARLVEVLQAAPDRTSPRCAHFGVCGGCALQHLAPESQLAAKQLELKDTLERVARVMPQEWLPPLTGPAWNYRRRARLGVKYVAKKGRVVVGFRERLAPYVAALERCEVLAAPMDSLIAPLSAMLTTLSIRERLPQIEVAVADNATAMVLRVLSAPSASDLSTLRAFEQEHGVRFHLQPGGLDSVHRLPQETGSGRTEPALFYALPRFDLTLDFRPTDFIQVNGPINEALVSRAVELIAPEPDAAVLDLYCGLGNFTLALARRAARVVGVEGDAALVERARQNARKNGLENVSFQVSDLAQGINAGAQSIGLSAVSAPAWAAFPYDYVLLDPPRAGAREMLPTVARLRPKRVLYISCHPGSLARDVGMLTHDHGFTLKAAGVLDMFPHTTHVESLAVLEPTRPQGLDKGRAA